MIIFINFPQQFRQYMLDLMERGAKEFLWVHALRHRWILLGATVCTIATNALAAGIPWVIRKILDHPEERHFEWFALIVLMGVATLFVRALSRYGFFIPARTMEYEIRDQFFRHILMFPLQQFRDFSIGDLLSRANQDVQAIRMLSGFVCLSAIHVTSALLLNFAFMLKLSPLLTLGIAAILAAVLIVVYRGSRTLMALTRRYFKETGRLTDTMTQILHSVPLLRNYRAIPEAMHVLEVQQNHVVKPQLEMISIRAWIIPLLGLVTAATLGALLIVMGLSHNAASFTAGSIAAYLGHVALLVSPLTQLSWMISMAQNATTGIDRINEVLTVPEAFRFTVPRSPQRLNDLTVENLSIARSSPSRNLLKDISLEWRPGRLFGFFGATGSGKSILFRAIAGLESFDGRPISSEGRVLSSTDLLQSTLYVSQTPFLFSDSIRNNICLGREGISDESILLALEHAGMLLDHERFEKGLDTRVGQKGVLLSGGQRQRIALARALVHPPSLLLLDDVLSSVDHETEYRIISNLYKCYRFPGFWIASHRISALRLSDEIFCLDRGEIAARGTHAELLRTYEPYQRIFALQMRDFQEFRKKEVLL